MYSKCLVNEKESYYSCSGQHEDTSRICPCRKASATKAPSSLFGFGGHPTKLLGADEQDGNAEGRLRHGEGGGGGGALPPGGGGGVLVEEREQGGRRDERGKGGWGGGPTSG